MKNTKIMIATVIGAFLLLCSLDIKACPTCYGLSEEYKAPFFSDEFYPDKSQQANSDTQNKGEEKYEQANKSSTTTPTE